MAIAKLNGLERFVLAQLREAFEVHGVLGPGMPGRCRVWVADRQTEQGIPARGRADGALVLDALVEKGYVEHHERDGFAWYRVIREGSGTRIYCRLVRTDYGSAGPKTLWAQRRAALIGAMAVAPCSHEQLVAALDRAGLATPSMRARPRRVQALVDRIEGER